MLGTQSARGRVLEHLSADLCIKSHWVEYDFRSNLESPAWSHMCLHTLWEPYTLVVFQLPLNEVPRLQTSVPAARTEPGLVREGVCLEVPG